MVSSHSAHAVATGDEYCIEITTNYRYMLLSCTTLGDQNLEQKKGIG